MPAANLDPQSGVFHAITVGSVALQLGFLGILAALLVTAGNAAAWAAPWPALHASHSLSESTIIYPPRSARFTLAGGPPYVSILVQAAISAAILLGSQISETTGGAYQLLIDAAIILYFIPFLYMFAAVIKLARRKDRTENPHAVLVPGGIAGVWIAGGLGFIVVLVGILVSLVPPGNTSNKLGF